MPINPQQPFAYQLKARRYGKAKPRKKESTLSNNIKGLCTYCKFKFQRVKKHNDKGEKLPVVLCPTCGTRGRNSIVIDIPDTMRPWKIIDRSIYGHSYVTPFICQRCAQRYADFATFGSLCAHKLHTPLTGGFFCRWCCSKEDEIKPETNEELKKAMTTQFLYVDPRPLPATPHPPGMVDVVLDDNFFAFDPDVYQNDEEGHF